MNRRWDDHKRVAHDAQYTTGADPLRGCQAENLLLGFEVPFKSSSREQKIWGRFWLCTRVYLGQNDLQDSCCMLTGNQSAYSIKA